MRMTHPGKPRIPNSIALAAGIVLVLGSIILGGQMGADETSTADCPQPTCMVATDAHLDDDAQEEGLLKNTLNTTGQHVSNQTESSKRAARNQLLLLFPGR